MIYDPLFNNMLMMLGSPCSILTSLTPSDMRLRRTSVAAKEGLLRRIWAFRREVTLEKSQ